MFSSQAGGIQSRFVAKAVLLQGNDSSETPLSHKDSASAASSSTDSSSKPQPAYDPRTLYERLKEQREKKEEEFNEKFKLGNQIRKLDSDEIEFLRAQEEERKQHFLQEQEQLKEGLEEFRRQAEKLREETAESEARPSSTILLPKTSKLFLSSAIRDSSSPTASSQINPAKKSSLAPNLDGVVVKKKSPATSKTTATSTPAHATPSTDSTSTSSKRKWEDAAEASPSSTKKPPINNTPKLEEQPPVLNMLVGYDSDD